MPYFMGFLQSPSNIISNILYIVKSKHCVLFLCKKRSYKLSLPAEVIKALGVAPEDRSVVITIDGGKVIIQKSDDCSTINNSLPERTAASEAL